MVADSQNIIMSNLVNLKTTLLCVLWLTDYVWKWLMGEAQQELDLESVAQNCNCETAFDNWYAANVSWKHFRLDNLTCDNLQRIFV